MAVAVCVTPPSDPDHAVRIGDGNRLGDAVTTNEAYQCPPTESRVIRTLDGSDGNSRDHTTGILTPLGNTSRPSRIPRRVYSSDGNVFFRALKRGPSPRPLTVNEVSNACA